MSTVYLLKITIKVKKEKNVFFSAYFFFSAEMDFFPAEISESTESSPPWPIGNSVWYNKVLDIVKDVLPKFPDQP